MKIRISINVFLVTAHMIHLVATGVYSQWRLLPSVSVRISIDLNLSFVYYFMCKPQASACIVDLLKQYHSI